MLYERIKQSRIKLSSFLVDYDRCFTLRQSIEQDINAWTLYILVINFWSLGVWNKFNRWTIFSDRSMFACLSNNIGSLKALKIISLLIIRKAAYYWLILSLFRRGKFVKLETTIWILIKIGRRGYLTNLRICLPAPVCFKLKFSSSNLLP